MKLVAELSMYPLNDHYIDAIKSFIQRLNSHDVLKVVSTSTSTMVQGDYADVMTILGREMQRCHEEVGQAVFVCKFLNGDKMSGDIGLYQP